MKLIEEWVHYSSKYNLIDNSPSKNKNLNGFVQNRNDQSIFSLLTKKHQLFSDVSLLEYIEVLRNRSGNSRLK